MEEEWYTWVFSGIGVSILGVVAAILWRYKGLVLARYSTAEPESMAVIDIMEATYLWSGFVGDLYCFNPSWHTELVTKPNEWSLIHKARYLNDKLKRVVYIVAKNGHNDKPRKYFYLDGIKEFFDTFFSFHPELEQHIKSKLHIYVHNQLPTELSFFIGKKENDKIPFSQ